MYGRLRDLSRKLLEKEIEKTGSPPLENHKICLEYGEMLAEEYEVDADFISACLNFMDLKIGKALRSGKIQDHIQMSLDATMQAIEALNLDSETVEKIKGCVSSHHGVEGKYPSIEAEICANADCFKFLHPKGVFAFLHALGKRGMELEKALEYVRSKLDEKMAIISLPEVKEEAKNYYGYFDELLRKAR